MVKINIDEINRRMENAVKIKELREKVRMSQDDFSRIWINLNFGKKMNTQF